MTQTTSGLNGSALVRLHKFWVEVAAARAAEAEGAFGSCSFFARTTALRIEIAVTSAAGTAVHQISRPVWPWTGGPSESSSARARNFSSEYTITAATRAKIAMEIVVTNQKTKPILFACALAAPGRQGLTS